MSNSTVSSNLLRAQRRRAELEEQRQAAQLWTPKAQQLGECHRLAAERESALQGQKESSEAHHLSR